MLEKVYGPFSGYYVAIHVCEMGELGDKFLASYKICDLEPTDYFKACAVRQKCVGGLSDEVEEAVEIALQLARLQISRLRVLKGVQRPQAAQKFSLPDLDIAPHSYQPTMPASLQGIAGLPG